MHLLIPFAAPLSEAGRQAAHTLRLPALDALLRTMELAARDDGDETTLSPPHERAVARELGLEGGDGQLPWAAHEAARAGIPTGAFAWGRLTPVHWHVGTDQVSLADPAALALDTAQSRALFDAVRPLFDGEDLQLVWQGPLQWFVAHPSLAALPTASLDRVVGRNVDRWLPSGDDAKLVRRLQMEMQMLWHEHPVNVEREARGLLPVNSVWLSGCGARQSSKSAPTLRIDDRLRGPALAEDWPAWSDAWQALDAALGDTVHTLTLCGERSAARYEAKPRNAWQRFRAALQPVPVTSVLESL